MVRSQVATLCGTVRNPSFVEVTFTDSSSFLRYFDIGPSPKSSKIRLLKPLLPNLYF